jgi:hypothetical protein
VFEIAEVFNMCTSKRLELPLDLLELFVTHRNKEHESMTDEGINILRKQFLGEDGVGLSPMNGLLIERGHIFMHNTSNFMQGIFHYVSSLMHCGHLLTLEVIIDGYLKMLNIDSRITSKVSSDDSSMLITLFTSDERYTNTHLVGFAGICSYMKQCSYPYFCAKQSLEKSTPFCLSDMEEFNSMWIIGKSLSSIPIKFVESSMKVSGVSRIEERFNTFATLRS